MVSGLREALKIGIEKSVRALSQLDGFFGNPKIRIPLPGIVQKSESVLRAAGMGKQVEAFELSMNRAAEKASEKAAGALGEALQSMTVSDAEKILNGGDDAATQYFKSKTWNPLSEEFKPIVNEAMAQVGVTQTYQELSRQMQTLPFGSSAAVDLDQYVTDRTLEGLFFMIGEEEKKIRQDPSARATELLQTVFGSK
jgi:hypothetical protein